MYAYVYKRLHMHTSFNWCILMTSKMVSLAVRVSHEDAEFISQLKIEGAKTPSDKMRAIIAEARRRELGIHDFKTSLELTHNILDPVYSRIREAELDNEMHSELLTRTIEWLPEILAYIISRQDDLDSKNESKKALNETEKGVADRVFRFMESTMQMGVTKRSPCYNTNTVLERVEPVLELSQIVERTFNSWNKEK